MNLAEQIKREKVLLAIYEMADGRLQAVVETVRLAEKLNMDHGTTVSDIGVYLREEGYITWQSFSMISITHQGRKEAERLRNLSYAENEARMLQMIYEMSGPDKSDLIVFEKLMLSLNIRLGLARQILTDFSDRRSYIDWSGGDAIRIRAEGIEAYEGRGQRIDSPDVNIMNIDKNYGAAAIGSNISQVVNVNPEFDKAISSLIELVQSSDLESHDKDELKDDIVKVNKLATRNSPVEKVTSRFEFVKAGLQAGNLLVAASPHLEAIWHYFKIKYNL